MAAKFVLKAADRGIVEQWLRSPTLPQAWGLRAKIVLASADGEGVPEMARRLETTTATVCLWRRRYLREGLAGLQTGARSGRPRRISDFETELADVIGLYLDPPERAVVLCVDEKSQIQALNRTQPILPVRPGVPARKTQDYERNGTTSFFAALEVASGKVHGRCFSRHSHVEFIAFLDSLAKTYRRREIHLSCDNYGTHKQPKVREWLAAHPRLPLHFTPTSASWLNLVERWFALITSQAIRRGSFDSVWQLERAIAKYLGHWNENAKPFRWTESARQIRNAIRHAKAIYETGH
jgi:transposase